MQITKNNSIQSRISLVLLLAFLLIALIGGFSLVYFTQISGFLDRTVKSDILADRYAREIKETILDLRIAQKLYLESLKSKSERFDIQRTLDRLEKDLLKNQKVAFTEVNKQRIIELIGLKKTMTDEIIRIEDILDDPEAKETINFKEFDKRFSANILKTQEIALLVATDRHKRLEQHQNEIEVLTENAYRNMLLFIFVCLGGSLALLILAPKRVTAPINRYISAIAEVEDLKFDTRLPISSEDEVATLGKSINSLIDRFRTFDEIKIKRIQFEKSKQRVMANMLDLGVMMLAIEGNILFLNAQLANLLDFESEDYQGKDYHDVDFPDELKEMISEVLKTREKIDSRMMIFYYNKKGQDDKQAVEVLVDVGLVRNYQGDVVNLIITFDDITNPSGESVFKRISFAEQHLI